MKKIMILTVITLAFGVSELDAQQTLKFKSSSIFQDELDGTLYNSKSKRFGGFIDNLDPRGIFKNGSRDKSERGFIYEKPNKRNVGCSIGRSDI